MIKIIKKIFGIKTTYAIPSDNGVDITKDKKYKFKRISGSFGYIKDNNNIKIYIFTNKCEHINGGSWQIITE